MFIADAWIKEYHTKPSREDEFDKQPGNYYSITWPGGMWTKYENY